MATGRSRGFTLIEMVISIVVLAIIAAAATPLVVTSITAYDRVHEDLVSLDRVRYATERLAREIREVKHNGVTYEFASMSTSAPVFTKSDDTTVTLANSPPIVTLSYSVPAVTPPPILSNQVSALSFAYFDETGTETATSTATVRYVEVSLELTQGSQTYSQRTRVQLRNHN
jgi:MSHA biogenesis protein MshO